jgi:hypothetical protein
VEILPSAYRHGITAPDIDHAIAHALVVEEIGDDPLHYLVLGPRPSRQPAGAGHPRPRRDGPAVIHAMPMRRQHARLLPKE